MTGTAFFGPEANVGLFEVKALVVLRVVMVLGTVDVFAGDIGGVRVAALVGDGVATSTNPYPGI